MQADTYKTWQKSIISLIGKVKISNDTDRKRSVTLNTPADYIKRNHHNTNTDITESKILKLQTTYNLEEYAEK